MIQDMKGWDRFADALEHAIEANKGAAGLVLAEATKRLQRISDRAEADANRDDDGWEEWEIAQTRGPTVKFVGRRLAGQMVKTQRHDGVIEMQIWETRKGALVAFSAMKPTGGDFEDVRVRIVEPDEDVAAMRREVLDFFNWDNKARSMVREQLDWDLSIEVE